MPLNNPDPENLYTSSQVRERLHIAPSTLTMLVERKVIGKVVFKGYKNGFYTKKSVESYLNHEDPPSIQNQKQIEMQNPIDIPHHLL